MKSKTMILASVVAAFGAAANADEQANLTIFGPDISASFGLLYDQVVANEVAENVTQYIARLDHPHDLWMASFGEPGLAKRQINIKATVTNRRASSAKKLALTFGSYFRMMPDVVASGGLEPQGSTSIIEFLYNVAPICKEHGAHIMLFTDGIESSSAVSGAALTAGTTTLPMPSEPFLTGCRVTMHGVGQVKGEMSAEGLSRRLIPQWQKFLSAAGAENIRVFGSFF